MKRAFVFVLVLVLLACNAKKRDDANVAPAPSSPAGPPELRLVPTQGKKGEATIECSGALCGANAKLPLGADGKLYVDMTSCTGCTVEVGTQKIVVKGDPYHAAIDMTDAIAGVELAGADQARIAFKVTRGGDVVEVDMLGNAAYLLGPVLRRIARTPLAFAGETTPAAGSTKRAVIVESEDLPLFRLVGAPKTMRDVDRIGVVTTIDKRRDAEHIDTSWDVTLYERRTGKAIGKRTFPAEETVGASRFPSEAKVIAWIDQS